MVRTYVAGTGARAFERSPELRRLEIQLFDWEHERK